MQGLSKDVIFKEEAQWDWSQVYKDVVLVDLECEDDKANDGSESVQIVLTQIMVVLMDLV